jgi:plastocyanin
MDWESSTRPKEYKEVHMRLFRLPHRSRATTCLVLAGAAVLALTLGLVATSCGSATSTSTTAGVTTTASGVTSSSAPAGGSTSSSVAAGGGAQVEIKGFAFNPASVTIKVGETVTWTNNDSATHTIVPDNGDFAKSGDLAQGATYTATFDKAGTFPYHCGIHPNMKATITVQ